MYPTYTSAQYSQCYTFPFFLPCLPFFSVMFKELLTAIQSAEQPVIVSVSEKVSSSSYSYSYFLLQSGTCCSTRTERTAVDLHSPVSTFLGSPSQKERKKERRERRENQNNTTDTRQEGREEKGVTSTTLDFHTNQPSIGGTTTTSGLSIPCQGQPASRGTVPLWATQFYRLRSDSECTDRQTDLRTVPASPTPAVYPSIHPTV